MIDWLDVENYNSSKIGSKLLFENNQVIGFGYAVIIIGIRMNIMVHILLFILKELKNYFIKYMKKERFYIFFQVWFNQKIMK